MADTSIARTGEVAASKNVHEIIKEAKRIEETTLYSSKGHFAAAENWSKLHLWIGVPNAGLAAVAGAMALSFTTQAWIHVLGGGLAIVAAGLASLQTFLNPNEKAAAHLAAGNNYDALNGQVRIFWSVECWGGQTELELTEKLKTFANEKERLNKSCPQIPSWAYAHAKKGIAAGEGTYVIDTAPTGSSDLPADPPDRGK